ncbi:hypothetical protein D3C73_1387810 [compost metagenome]
MKLGDHLVYAAKRPFLDDDLLQVHPVLLTAFTAIDEMDQLLEPFIQHFATVGFH